MPKMKWPQCKGVTKSVPHTRCRLEGQYDGYCRAHAKKKPAPKYKEKANA